MNLNEIIKHFTHNIVDLNENKWKVIEVSDIEEICKEYHKQQLILSGVSQQRELLNAFQEYYQNGDYNDEYSFDENQNRFLKAFNCG